ncbi:MAG: hypothetical protein ACOYZ6_14945 [Chloroflexota bacterium]
MKIGGKMKKYLAITLFCAILVSSCGAVTPYSTVTKTLLATNTLTAVPTITAKPSTTPFPFFGSISLSRGTEGPTITPHPTRTDVFSLPPGWNIAEYELTKQTGFSRNEYVRRHFDELGGEYYYVTGYDYTKVIDFNGQPLEIFKTALDGTSVLISAAIGGKEVLIVETGPLYNTPCSVMSLWIYRTHWAIEILRRDNQDVNGKLYEEIFVDGKSVLVENGYDRTFGASLIDEKLFYFFEKGGRVGFNYDGTEYYMDYDHIAYACCCGESLFNPHRFMNAIGFNARKDGRYYYVLIGLIRP